MQLVADLRDTEGMDEGKEGMRIEEQDMAI
jgi:hypothetical protein